MSNAMIATTIKSSMSVRPRRLGCQGMTALSLLLAGSFWASERTYRGPMGERRTKRAAGMAYKALPLFFFARCGIMSNRFALHL
jgi:hypothetical protein